MALLAAAEARVLYRWLLLGGRPITPEAEVVGGGEGGGSVGMVGLRAGGSGGGGFSGTFGLAAMGGLWSFGDWGGTPTQLPPD